ncbi:MAG: DUF481 domain-containing protein [Candidatus Omnitrophota bacterium]
MNKKFIYGLVVLCILLISSFSVYADEASKEQGKWKREASAGYNLATGNTEESQLSGKFIANKKTDHYEFSLKGDAYYSSSDEKMNAQKYSGMTRFAYSFGSDLKWYNFYSLDAGHDRFADIDYRLVSAGGIGYWFSAEPDFKALVELGAGVEHTNFRGNVEDKTEMVLIPRGYVEKRLWGESRISEDIKVYPAIADGGEFRIYSETAFTNPITDVLSLRVSVLDEYNSDPPLDTKKNDIRLISSIVYTF